MSSNDHQDVINTRFIIRMVNHIVNIMRIYLLGLILLNSLLLSACNDEGESAVTVPPDSELTCTIHCAP